MKSKIILIIALLFFQWQLIFSQHISVELSVTWEMEYDIFEKDSMVCTPKLHITYRNNSNTNYYFLKMSDNRNGLPIIGCDVSIHPIDYSEYLRWRDDYLGRAKSHGNYANENFHVLIGGGPSSFIHDWEVMSDTVYLGIKYAVYSGIESEYTTDFINCGLENIHRYIHHSNNTEYTFDANLYFSTSDITSENILQKFKNQFVFLKPDETYIDTYNLAGFKLVEGCFTFVIDQNTFVNYVRQYSETWDNNQYRWIPHEIEFPVKAGEYTLYSGSFNTNKIVICFGSK